MKTNLFFLSVLFGLATTVGCDPADRTTMSDSAPSTVNAPATPPANSASSDVPPSSSETGTHDADNTKVNVRDRGDNVKTPIDQNENQKDIDITAEIRKRVVDTKMSINAQNVKVITQDGQVTLRGPVKSADEKTRIQEIAVSIAGNGNVDNQIDVESNP